MTLTLSSLAAVWMLVGLIGIWSKYKALSKGHKALRRELETLTKDFPIMEYNFAQDLCIFIGMFPVAIVHVLGVFCK